MKIGMIMANTERDLSFFVIYLLPKMDIGT